MGSLAHGTLDVLKESRIDEYWNIDGDRSLSESSTGVRQFTILMKNLQTGICGPEGG